MKKFKSKKIIIIVLLIFSLILISCKPEVENNEPPIINPPILEEYNVIKDETIYVNLLSNGQVDKIEIINHLRNINEGKYVDYGDFKTAYAISGLNEINIKEDYLELKLYDSYDNYYYQTELSRETEIPFIVDISYYYEDVLYEPNDIKGKSGKIKIKIDVTSNPNVSEVFNDRLAFQLQVPISIINNSIISHNASSQVLVGKNMTLAFMVLPKQSKSFEIILDSKSFELDSMQASIQSFDINSMLGFDLDDLFNGVNLLISALSDINDGGSLLKEGLFLVDENLNLLNGALELLSNGLVEFDDGLDDVYNGLVMLQQGFNPISDGLNLLSEEGDQLIQGFSGLKDSLIQIIDGLYNITSMPGMPSEEDLNELKNGLILFDYGLNRYHQGVKDIALGMSGLNNGFNQLVSNFPDILDGSNDLKEGSITIKEGLDELTNQFGEIPLAMSELSDGLSLILMTITELTSEFDDFQIDDNIRLPSFTSELNETPNSVQFIYNIKGISLRS